LDAGILHLKERIPALSVADSQLGRAAW
jgi:hypothetical protein